jgi:hypothetical protein
LKPSLFIGSSTEGLEIAYAMQENLEHVSEVTVWTQGIFELSKYSLDALLDALDASDFGLFVFAPDDVSVVRGAEKPSIRDNVIFEMGLFVGRLGKERSFIVLPRGSEDTLHFPTDLLGLTPALYEASRQDGNLRAALGPACSKVTRAITKLGKVTASLPTRAEESAMPLVYSEDDKKAILASWMGSPTTSENTTVIHFAQVDRELRLDPGTTKKYIKEVAARWDYLPRHEGRSDDSVREAFYTWHAKWHFVDEFVTANSSSSRRDSALRASWRGSTLR